ncbi:thiamine ABC transporter substrate-binding protein [Nocardioides perillae]|uniref:Thiamine transport system substrate-binding protein n=1 Tax=Nocardioides perillae TaxID=1119534 RepID=A0A7Y9RSH3_9ACTN|nr:thiamine ABC transporter substrate-binding protein [Nocardioides perillae]NYG53843.1 thiamine transport system substrate-binding protein [Nocardioides perillae]
MRLPARARTTTTLTSGLLTAALLSACTLTGGGGDEAAPASDPTGSAGRPTGEVVLVTHESFALPEELVADFEAESGLQLTQRASGDAGTLTNRLVLTKDSPTGDLAFGVDNTFASRALEEGVFAESSVALPPGAEAYALEEGGDRLLPVDNGNVCVNVDTAWFEREGLEPPQTLDDLVDPRYRDLLVTPGAPTSSPGLAFLLSTVAEYGDDWPDYWRDLVDNGAEVVPGWSDAYYVDFTAGGGDGARPIVVSYDSSPAFTLDGRGGTTTAALLDTCFLQVEYAGVLEGADNPAGAEVVLEWLLSPEVQAALPESMYVFPVRDDVELPADWARFAERPETPYEVDPAEVAENRDDWLRTWTDVVTG